MEQSGLKWPICEGISTDGLSEEMNALGVSLVETEL
jgi:hypothetical protein